MSFKTVLRLSLLAANGYIAYVDPFYTWSWFFMGYMVASLIYDVKPKVVNAECGLEGRYSPQARYVRRK